mmetsp:Transcript_72830/g.201944  ORF Transcript_72830/g.201944 Transcript_72830/m.201944 type:complete len:208 (-) Transcript_72830:582-1205(-)
MLISLLTDCVAHVVLVAAYDVLCEAAPRASVDVLQCFPDQRAPLNVLACREDGYEYRIGETLLDAPAHVFIGIHLGQTYVVVLSQVVVQQVRVFLPRAVTRGVCSIVARLPLELDILDRDALLGQLAHPHPCGLILVGQQVGLCDAGLKDTTHQAAAHNVTRPFHVHRVRLEWIRLARLVPRTARVSVHRTTRRLHHAHVRIVGLGH